MVLLEVAAVAWTCFPFVGLTVPWRWAAVVAQILDQRLEEAVERIHGQPQVVVGQILGQHLEEEEAQSLGQGPEGQILDRVPTAERQSLGQAVEVPQSSQLQGAEDTAAGLGVEGSRS